MERFYKLYLNKLKFSYDSFDRIVLNGYISAFHQANHLTYYFKEILCQPYVNKKLLFSVTEDYKKAVAKFAETQSLSLEYVDGKARKESLVARERQQFERKGKFGVYRILKTIETENTFRVVRPKKKDNDPDNHLSKVRKSYTHYYFYIHDEVLGNLSIRIASYLPFKVTAYLNGHSYIERYLKTVGGKKAIYRKKENAFLNIKDINLLSEAKANFTPELVQERLDYWIGLIGPKLPEYSLNYDYFINQIEYCRNFIFKGHFFLKQLFKRSCELSMLLIGNDSIKQIFKGSARKADVKKSIERLDNGAHVFKAFFKRCFIKQYQKFPNMLRFEVTCNHLPDLRLKKSLRHLPAFAKEAESILDRYSESEALMLNAHADVDHFRKLAAPVMVGATKIPAIHVYQERMSRLMQVLLHDNAAISQFKSMTLRSRILCEFEVDAANYSRNQIIYDIRKLRAHGILQRVRGRNAYQLTDYGVKVALSFTLMRKRIYGPLHYSLFHHQPDASEKTESKLEQMYRKLDAQLNDIQAYLADGTLT